MTPSDLFELRGRESCKIVGEVAVGESPLPKRGRDRVEKRWWGTGIADRDDEGITPQQGSSSWCIGRTEGLGRRRERRSGKSKGETAVVGGGEMENEGW